jgi:glycosyltransferase involved in cell wall biosynthesis
VTASATHLVLIPCYNAGQRLRTTILGARRSWTPVWAVDDGSTDGSRELLAELAAQDPGLRVLAHERNRGKGAAVLHGLTTAHAAGFTHALVMDADGQHPADRIATFMSASAAHPEAMVLGEPVFDSSAPSIRVKGRRISNWWANFETLWTGVHDSLFGFRVYPIAPLIRVMRHQPWMRRFDFDVEAVVRLRWLGVPAINLPAPVRYFRPDEGGVSHFRYGRDNALLTWMHARLMAGFLLRLPFLAVRRARRR